MALVSILLSVVALLCTAIGFFTTPIPVLGTLFSFGAAAIALLGVVLGGRAVSAAKREERPNDTARIGVVLSALALVPALLVALTCGVCNALFSSGNVQVQRDFQLNMGGLEPDAGPNALPPPARPAEPGAPPAEPGRDEPLQPSQAQPTSPPVGAPPQQPSSLPPPPLPAGPGR